MTDALAKEGSKLDKENIFLWMKILPMFLTSMIAADKEGTFFVRTKKSSLTSDFVNVTTNNHPSEPSAVTATSMY